MINEVLRVLSTYPSFDFLKFINTVLIGAEGARSSKMLTHFLRAVFVQGSLFNVLRE
ncbi:hypothetical protein LG291_05415 [Cytobacillus firmus]|uniref:hypothetical protein n=1 Tax=Cytobacillus firmus TaxID=1399 RepID=UPI00384BC727